jgi:hypothetical protein
VAEDRPQARAHARHGAAFGERFQPQVLPVRVAGEGVPHVALGLDELFERGRLLRLRGGGE